MRARCELRRRELKALPKRSSWNASALRIAAGELEALPNPRAGSYSVVGCAGTKDAHIANPPQASWFVSGANNMATTLSSKTSNCWARHSGLS